MKEKELVKCWEDVGFVAVAGFDPDPRLRDKGVDYVVYKVDMWTEEGKPLFAQGGYLCDMGYGLDKAEPYLHGRVKWDGCSNWFFDEQDRLMLHGCTRQDLVNLGEVMAKCWDWTKDLLPLFDSYFEMNKESNDK